MIEKAHGLLDAILQTVNNKITTTVLAAGVAVTGKTSSDVKGLADIPITEIFNQDLSALAWTMLIATGWILFQFAREIIKGALWLRDRRNGKN